MAAILALPPPSSLPASTTTGRAKALLASDAPPVTPIRPTADEQRRRELRQLAGEDRVKAAEDDFAASVSGKRSGGFSAADFKPQGENARSQDVREERRGRAASLAAGPSSAFIAQSLYQENVGAGLHIEPWAQALNAYRRADSAGAQGYRASVAV